MNTEISVLAKEFRLHGILAHLDEIKEKEELAFALQRLLSWEQSERMARKYKASMRATHLHRYCPFDSFAKFDWSWPRKIDKGQISDLFTLEFLKESANVIFFGPSGVGKTTLAKNLVESAATKGKNAVFMECADLLDDLLSENNRYSMRQRIERYAKPELLAMVTFRTIRGTLMFCFNSFKKERAENQRSSPRIGRLVSGANSSPMPHR